MPWTPAHIIGLSIAVPAFLLLVVARLQLGSAFSVQAKASALVTTGLYSRIRNPIYVFGGLFIAGIILWQQTLAPAHLRRSHPPADFPQPERSKVLEAKFGPAYLDYKQKTWF